MYNIFRGKKLIFKNKETQGRKPIIHPKNKEKQL